MSNTPNIFIVWDRMGDYHRARLAALADLLPNQKIIGADLGSSDKLYGWQTEPIMGCTYICLSDKPIGESDFLGRVSKFYKVIKANDIGIVGISGYGRIEYIVFLILAWACGVSIVMFAESWYSKNKVVNLLKGCFLSVLVKGFFVSGSRAKAHFHHDLGIDFTRIRIGYSCVDNAHFRQYRHANRAENQSILSQSEISLNPEKILLCVARFSPEKNLASLIKNFTKSDLGAEGWQLWLIGGGPQEQELKNLANQAGNIRFLNWQNYQSLPEYYGQASAFVLPSLFEPWGLVINEAMAAGLPILASWACGAVPDIDLLTTGWGFEADSDAQMIIALNQLAHASPIVLEQKGQAASRQIDNFTTKKWAENFVVLGN